MKFLCDQMLVRLGRWLRAAGYDTIIIEESIEDKEIIDRAKKENRFLITRDKRLFLELDPKKEHVIWLQANNIQECVREISQILPINWLLKPFSRCLKCNSLLMETNHPNMNEIPESIQKEQKHFWVCLKCEKVYWEGSHTKRMHKQLKEWQGL